MWGGRCGGVLFDLGGNIVKLVACGLGFGTNNYAERMALFLSLKLSVEDGVHSLIVIGDSYLVIYRDIQGIYIYDQIVGRLHTWILNFYPHFEYIIFFHVLRDLNHWDDELDNIASHLPIGGYEDNDGKLKSISLP